MPRKRKLKARLCALLIILLLVLLIPFAVNFYMILSAANQIVAPEAIASTEIAPQCILVLGAGVTGSGSPSPMLKDRLDTALLLYDEGYCSRLLLSGDHGKQYYDEVSAMLNYCLERGVPEEDIFLDHAGFSTYESVVRAKEIFEVEEMIVVTQRYHLYRALYICERAGIKAVGVSATVTDYRGQWARDKREFLARNKDFYQTLAWPDPRFLGEKIPITGDSSPSYEE